jgi:hypothetical protein
MLIGQAELELRFIASTLKTGHRLESTNGVAYGFKGLYHNK